MDNTALKYYILLRLGTQNQTVRTKTKVLTSENECRNDIDKIHTIKYCLRMRLIFIVYLCTVCTVYTLIYYKYCIDIVLGKLLRFFLIKFPKWNI